MVDESALKAWFFREIFPLEPALTRYIRRNWRNEADVADLRQEIYVKVWQSARGQLPMQPKPFLFTTARNHLINSARRAPVISIEVIADLEAAAGLTETLTPERTATARDELRRVQAGLDRLPPRRREAVLLKKVEGLSQREVARRMGIGEDAVEQHMVKGMRALVDFMMGGSGPVRRRVTPARRAEGDRP